MKDFIAYVDIPKEISEKLQEYTIDISFYQQILNSMRNDKFDPTVLSKYRDVNMAYNKLVYTVNSEYISNTEYATNEYSWEADFVKSRLGIYKN